jgi:hypothetical protein
LFRVAETGLDQSEWPEEEKRDYAADHLKGWRFHAERLAALDFSDHESTR